MNAEKLRAEKVKLDKRWRQLDKKWREVGGRIRYIDQQLATLAHRERLTLLIGVPNGVRVNTREAPGHRLAWQNDATGTLVDIRRTRCTVDYGEHGTWNIPLYKMAPATDRQAVTLAALRAGDMP